MRASMGPVSRLVSLVFDSVIGAILAAWDLAIRLWNMPGMACIRWPVVIVGAVGLYVLVRNVLTNGSRRPR
jgi:hypothetical protein